MSDCLFVTGTDTDAGKTYISRLLLRGALQRGMKAGYMKPVASGCENVDGTLISADIRQISRELDLAADPSDINPIQYTLPASPYQASLQEGDAWNRDAVMDAFYRLKAEYTPLIVEGIGGLAVPLSERIYVYDLIHWMNIPLLIVAANRLGVINHTLLTVHTAVERGITIAGIILSRVNPPDDDPTVLTNGAEITALTDIPVLEETAYGAEALSDNTLDILFA